MGALYEVGVSITLEDRDIEAIIAKVRQNLKAVDDAAQKSFLPMARLSAIAHSVTGIALSRAPTKPPVVGNADSKESGLASLLVLRMSHNSSNQDNKLDHAEFRGGRAGALDLSQIPLIDRRSNELDQEISDQSAVQSDLESGKNWRNSADLPLHDTRFVSDQERLASFQPLSESYLDKSGAYEIQQPLEKSIVQPNPDRDSFLNSENQKFNIVDIRNFSFEDSAYSTQGGDASPLADWSKAFGKGYLEGGQNDRRPSGDAALPEERKSSGPSQGDVYLDGAYLGRWLSQYLRSQVARATNGPTGFDPRRSPTMLGATVSGQ